MKIAITIFCLLVSVNVYSQNAAVNTETREIEYQKKQTFEANGISFSNEFAGGRLNSVEVTNDTLIRITITPENSPVNPSPWYAFKFWSMDDKTISIHLKYEGGLTAILP